MCARFFSFVCVLCVLADVRVFRRGRLPPYFSEDAWEPSEMKTWIKDGDLVVATAAKSGTTWMLFCTHQIRTKGSDDVEYRDVSYSTPWPDCIQKPGNTWAMQKEMLNTTVLADGKKLVDYWNHPNFPFRIFKSHYTPTTIKVKEFPKVKFLSMVRNGLDVVSSLVPFFRAHSDEFRTMWGGFPPSSPDDVEADRAARIAEVLPGGTLGGVYFNYAKEWWPYRNEPNVLMLHYADAVKDLGGTIAKLADFLDVKLSSEEKAKVTEKCGMPYMKRNTHMFNYALPLNPEYNAQDKRIMVSGSLTRKGGLGEGKAIFTDDQKTRSVFTCIVAEGRAAAKGTPPCASRSQSMWIYVVDPFNLPPHPLPPSV